MEKTLMKELEGLNVGANTYILGYDTKAGKTGLIAVSQVSGSLPWFGRKWAKANSSSALERCISISAKASAIRG